MYPESELIRLAGHKAALRRDIAWRREQMAGAAARVARPLAWLDRAVAFWRRLSPFTQLAALPLGFALKRAVFPRVKLLGPLMRWAPLVFGAVRGVMRHRAEAASPED